MRVGVLIPPVNDMHIETLKAFAIGLEHLGVDFFIQKLDANYSPCDIAVIFGVGKKGVPISIPRGEVLTRQRDEGKRTIVLERGYVHRESYFAAGFDGLNGRADFVNQGSPNDRWNDLGISLAVPKTITPIRDKLLVVGQVPSDASVQNVDIFKWCQQAIAQLKNTGVDQKNIIFRPHPLAIDRTPMIFGVKTSYEPLRDDLAKAYAVVTYNSNVGVDATIEGIPTYAADEGSMVWDVCNRSLKGVLVHGAHTDRTQWANELAYTQWTHEEMRLGLSFTHLVKCIKGEKDNATSK